MYKNVTVIIGSPKLKYGNSESMGDYLITRLNNKYLNYSKISLSNEVKNKDKLLEYINRSDTLILILPIYENSVPGLVLEFFENLYKNKMQLTEMERNLFVITNSGFGEIAANKNALKSCKLFSKAMGFSWLGGISIAPGTLIDGKKLLETENTYKRLIEALDVLSEAIINDTKIPEKVFKLTSKPFMSPWIYRFAGRILQNPVIKKVGKANYFSRPLSDSCN